MGREWSQSLEDPSLGSLDYQLLSLVTSRLVDNDKEFEVSGIL